MNHRDDSEPTPAPAKIQSFLTYFYLFGVDKQLKTINSGDQTDKADLARWYEKDMSEKARWFERPNIIKCPCCNSEKILYVCMDIMCRNNNNSKRFYCSECMQDGENHRHFPLVKVYLVINIIMEILKKDITYIKSITEKAGTSFQKFESFTVFLESEVNRVYAKDIKSVADDINALQKLFTES